MPIGTLRPENLQAYETLDHDMEETDDIPVAVTAAMRLILDNRPSAAFLASLPSGS
jgi:hypothetical protein